MFVFSYGRMLFLAVLRSPSSSGVVLEVPSSLNAGLQGSSVKP
jgi:hypothetical protein